MRGERRRRRRRRGMSCVLRALLLLFKHLSSLIYA
jgi:hypothetical protein